MFHEIDKTGKMVQQIFKLQAKYWPIRHVKLMI